MTRLLTLLALLAVIMPTAAQPQQSDGECELPRDKRFMDKSGSAHIGELYEVPIDTSRLSDPEVFDCLLKTAEKGKSRYAVEYAQILLWEGSADGKGGLFPRSESRLKKYIDIGVERGSHYSILAKAAYLQDIDPVTALELYRRLAKEDDCRGQVMLAWMYQQGIGVEINEAVAYFWGRLAARRPFIKPELSLQWGDNLVTYHRIPYFEQRTLEILTGKPNQTQSVSQTCSDLRGIIDLARLAKAPYAEDVHDMLLQWRPGQDAPDVLARYAGYQQGIPASRPAEVATQRPNQDKDVASRVTWKPVSAKFAPPATRPRSISALYDELSKSVYILVAAQSVADLRARRNLAQGSAVAIDFKTLITNCHIVAGRPMVYLATRNGLSPLNISSARISTDTCVLTAENDQFIPVPRVRPFDSLQVGETVIAIGAPSGFSNTLSTGIVSQLRTLDRQKLIQITAAISGGSSGGGLFDEKGNLIGITTFRIRDAESLNFAIPIDEYLRP